MALDDKQAGQKWYAFELNNILKEIRQIVAGLLSLNVALPWQYITTISQTTAITVPVGANFAVVDVTFNSYGYSNTCQLIVAKNGETTGAQQRYIGSTSDYWSLSSVWSGATLTTSISGGGTSPAITAVSAKFYT